MLLLIPSQNSSPMHKPTALSATTPKGVSSRRPSERRPSPFPATFRCRAIRRRSTIALASSSGGGDAGDAPEQGQRKSAEGDSDAPILFIKGLKEGGGVGVWGDDGREEDTATAVAEGLRNAQIGDGDGDGDEAEERSVWEKLQESLGLGTWSYVGLGLALFIILLNNVLGAGWLSRAINPDFDREGIINVEREGRQIQIMPLDDASNLLSQ